MRYPLGLLLTLLVVGALRSHADTLTYPDLVNRLTDLEHLATLSPAGEKTALASSYDRASQYDAANDKYVNWSANGDGGGIVREEQTDIVMADIKGPGCIWRIWSAAARGGHVKIYLDGSTTPTVDLPFKDYFDRDHGPFPWKNLCYVAAGEPPNPNEPGSSIYVPISFAKSCKITGDKQTGPDEQTGWGAYYQFNYTTFPEGTVVPTFKLPISDADKAALDAADKKLGQCGQDPAGPRAGEKTESKELTLGPGESHTVVALDGPGAITALKIKVPLNGKELDEEKKMLLRQLTIRISWDGESKPSVWSPLGDFFATIGGAQPFATLPVGLQADGTFYCYWYMPFGKSAKIELGNDGPDKVPLSVTVTHAPLDRPIDDFARFHAKWHRDSAQSMRADRWPDWNFLTTQGRGRFVGMMLHAFVPVNIWWGEGDEKFFVDGEKFPSDFGTGTEDYFGYAWGAQGQFVRPFHAQPLNENNCNHVDDIRWHIAESVPFQTSFDDNLEKYLYNDPMSVAKYPNSDNKPKPTDPHALYAAEAYWYLAPGGTDPYGSMSVDDRTKYWTTWAKYNEPGVIEGEWLKGIAHPEIREFGHMPYPAPTQQDAPDVFSGNRELLWRTDWGPQGKERMQVNVPVEKDGWYKVLVRLGKGPQCGIYMPTFEDKDLPTIDCYAPAPGAMDPVDLGTYELAAGDHPLEFMVAGSNPAGSQKVLDLGLDYIKLVPVTPTAPAHVRATGADDSSIHSITVGDPHPVPYNSGDTWDLAWTKQDTLYSPSDDSTGIRLGGNNNLRFNKITGDDPTNLDGLTVDPMDEYGITGATMQNDGRTWKSSGCISLDGVLYWLVARHQYGGDRSVDYDARQNARDASFIKSNDRGKTWSGTPQEHKDHPMFPGSRFATPYFVQYGQDGHEAWADGSDKYVYALSNNGFWDNGDWVILGRCLRSKMPELNGADWQFYTHGDGAEDKAWTSNVREAKAVLCNPDHLGMTRAVYLPKHQCYLMIGWYYPAGGGKLGSSVPGGEEAHVRTTWDFYVAAHPWGPWRNVGSHTWTPQGYYTPGVCLKFNSADESTVWAFTAGDWQSKYYALTAVPLTLK